MAESSAASAVLTTTPAGLYCPAGDFHIDPTRGAPRALVTHGHSDHARPGHQRYLSTAAAAPVLRHRLGEASLMDSEWLPWMEAWFGGMSRALLRGYLSHEPARRLLPEVETDRELLLNVFILERHLYELNFELEQQRGMAEIPLRGLLRRLGMEGA